MNGMKRMFATVLAFVLVLSGVYFGNTESKEVLATSETTSGTTDYETVEYETSKADTVKQMITEKKAPEKDGYLFAGWFNSENCALDTAISSVDEVSTTASSWAKFVPEDVLSVKCQIATEAEADGSTYVIRFISSVDGLDYRQVGFEANNGSGDSLKNETSTVFEKIYSTTDSVKYEFSPKVVDTKSEYFITAKMQVTDVELDYEVKAFWVTMDGTKVYGASRCVCVNDGQDSCTTVNMSFENTENVDLTGVTDLIANGYDTVLVRTDGETVHARVTVDVDTLASATLFNFTLADGTAVGSTIYRNLYTKYDGTAESVDTSWYTVYDGKEAEFVIATSADLYGLAQLSNDASYEQFGEEKFYVVSDITVNDMTVAQMKSAIESTDTTDDPLFWSPIGPYAKGGANQVTVADSNRYFSGTFDGQGHTIKGLCGYIVSGSAPSGLFGYALGATIKNIRLEDSYFGGATGTGSIAYTFDGTMESVYSNATIADTSGIAGGIVGRLSNEAKTSSTGADYNISKALISDCWYAGSIDSTYSGSSGIFYGGIVGFVVQGTTHEVSHCLNTGNMTIANNTTAKKNTNVGGIVGGQNSSRACMVADCLNTGSSTVESSATATNRVGAIGGSTVAVTVPTGSYVYSTSEWEEALVYGKTYTNAILAEGTTNTYESYLNIPNLDYCTRNNEDGYWVVRESDVPALKTFVDEWIDVAWYYDTEEYAVGGNDFEIGTAEELYGLSAISQKYVFTNDTITLLNDIEMNSGDADNWAEGKALAGVRKWTPIGAPSGYDFAGTLDGAGYTVRGIYCNRTAASTGFVGRLAGELKNLKLENSYIYSTKGNVGVVGSTTGSIDSIYSDAIVASSDAHVAGIVGFTGGTVNIANCWFAGSVTGAKQYVGGIAGRLNSGTVTIQDCLVTGTVNANHTGATMIAGGIVGGDYNTNWTLTRCLVTGTISGRTTTGIASLFGYPGAAGYTRTITDSYAKTGSHSSNALVAGTTSRVTVSDSSTTVDTPSRTTTPNLFRGIPWTTAEDGTPVLQLLNEKALKVIYNENMSYEKGQGGLAIYIPTEKGYINYNFVHTVDAGRNADMWRLTVANLANASGGIVKQITKDGAEWEMAVRIMDRPDFIGGYAHGDEIYTSLEMYVDGVETEITSLTQYTTFEEIKIVMDSVGYDPNDGTTKALDHHKEYIINKDGIKLDQKVVWTNEYNMRKSSYMAMMPPLKYSTTNSEDIITDSYYTDVDTTPVKITATDGFSLTTEDVSSVCVFGSKSGVYFTMSKANYNQSKVDSNSMILSDNGGLNYNKMYFVFCGEDTVEAGEVWTSTTTYNIEWK